MGSYTLTIYEDIYFPKNVKAPVGKMVVFLSLLLSLSNTDALGLGPSPIRKCQFLIYLSESDKRLKALKPAHIMSEVLCFLQC